MTARMTFSLQHLNISQTNADILLWSLVSQQSSLQTLMTSNTPLLKIPKLNKVQHDI